MGRDWIWFYDSINNVHKQIRDSVKEDYRSISNQIDSSDSNSDPYSICTVGRGEYVFVLEGQKRMKLYCHIKGAYECIFEEAFAEISSIFISDDGSRLVVRQKGEARVYSLDIPSFPTSMLHPNSIRSYSSNTIILNERIVVFSESQIMMDGKQLTLNLDYSLKLKEANLGSNCLYIVAA